MTTKRPTSQRKPAGDHTSSARAAAHLERLEAAEGKRMVVDLFKEDREALERLKAAGYGKTLADVIRRAIKQAASRQRNHG